MNESIVKADFIGNKLYINAEIAYSVYEEDGVVVAYCPMLELSTQADSKASAKIAFEEALSMFFDDLIQSKTLFETLEELGWKRKNNIVTKKSTNKFNTKSEKVSKLQYAVA